MIASLITLHSNPDTEPSRRRLLQGISLAILIGCILDLPLLLLDPSNNPFLLLAVLTNGLIAGYIFLRSSKHSLVFSTWLLCGGILVSLLINVPTETLFTRPIVIVFLIPMLIAGMLVGPQGTIVFGLLSVVGSAISILFQSITEFEWALSSIVLLGITTALISILIYSLESAYNRAQEQLKIAESARLDLLSREGELRLINTELTQTNSEMIQLLRLVQDLETPAIPLLDGVVVTPLVGHIDSRRAQNIYHSIIQATSEMKAHTLLIDMTGVPIIDQQVIQELQKLAQSVQLLGASVIMTGISPSIAQTMIALEADFSRITTMARLQDGIQYVIAQQK